MDSFCARLATADRFHAWIFKIPKHSLRRHPSRVMNSIFRRLLTFTVVFATTFGVVYGLRTCRSGADLSQVLAIFSKPKGQFKPQPFTLPDKAPLELGAVELLSRLNDEYARVTEAVVPSVVSINTTGVRSEQLRDLWGRTRNLDYPTQGQGSGVIVTAEGHVMTNHHVIAGQQKILVTLHDGKTYTAHLVGEDALLDIAVLKLDSAETFTPLKMGDSAQVKVGQIVLAVGNPFGLGETVTQGIISAKERSLSDNQRDLFQTDAAINPGNSGGPLVNLRGEIIGINVAIFSPDKQNPGFQGVGFSIPANDVKDALFQILKLGRPIRGYLGVQMHDLDLRVRSILDYHEEDGALVLGISPESPASAAGLQAGDVVRAMDGEKIHTYAQFFSLIQRAKVGSLKTLEVWRKGQSLRLKTTIAESGAIATPGQDPSHDPAKIFQALGLQVRDLSDAERARGLRGVTVTAVTANGLVATQLQKGDVIIAVNNNRIRQVSDFSEQITASVAVQETSIHLLREDQVYRVNLPALPPEG